MMVIVIGEGDVGEWEGCRLGGGSRGGSYRGGGVLFVNHLLVVGKMLIRGDRGGGSRLEPSQELFPITHRRRLPGGGLGSGGDRVVVLMMMRMMRLRMK